MPLANAVQLIAYPNRIGRGLADLGDFVDLLGNAVGGIHLLPPFPSNADGGFSPLTHREIDPAYGTWADVERLAAGRDLCLDLVLNHLADDSPEFQDYLRHGRASPHAALFVDVDALGPIGPEELARIHIRKEKEPFREIVFADGTHGRVWCTFTERQIDLDYRSEAVYRLMADNIAALAGHGVKLLRLDAFGYTTKQIGTSCFLVEPEVWRILEWFRATAAGHGVDILPEVHDHPSWQHAIARRGMWAYGFALPPLVLHALSCGDARQLKAWLRMCPHNQITVLDTHDGICIPDAEGLLPPADLEALIQDVSARSASPVLRRQGDAVHSVGAIYQLTCTFFDALRRDADAYLCARAIQFFTPGIPQVYYVGLLAGSNDDALLRRTGEAREINRHYYTAEEAAGALHTPTVRRLLRLMALRSTHPAFGGTFELAYSADDALSMGWRAGRHSCWLEVDLRRRAAVLRHTDEQGRIVETRC
ncbi:sucrose phosphorylase [Pseudothauera nasutitermitis]|uniref:Sucrose phosphorylase n=1 Tax=Pseudothauera nasutitermitis TaxID=2565930 RepID=A0A4S4B3C2_9RHOO|nr:sucrose phosphorylase [Pseudothauera nasutitermitis]THF67099.1 sucrose phosphorylase [Pseudothauera nasutitermitis]